MAINISNPAGSLKTVTGLVGEGAHLAGTVAGVVKEAAGPVAQVVKGLVPPQYRDLVDLSKEAVEEGADMGKDVSGAVAGWAARLS